MSWILTIALALTVVWLFRVGYKQSKEGVTKRNITIETFLIANGIESVIKNRLEDRVDLERYEIYAGLKKFYLEYSCRLDEVILFTEIDPLKQLK